MKKIAIFIMSCDKTADVARIFVDAFSKHWPNCPYEIYMGVNQNTTHLKTISAIPVFSPNSNWREETKNQLELITRIAPNVSHLMVFLDDFILKSTVDNSVVGKVTDHALNAAYNYLGLKELELSYISRAINLIKSKKLDDCLRVINTPLSHPYYSSLQVAIWDIDHLLSVLESCTSIWDFEKIKDQSFFHKNISESIIDYEHIVEKGKWNLAAQKICLKSVGNFNSGSREFFKVEKKHILKIRLSKILFPIFGYSFYRIRRLGQVFINALKQ